MRDLKFKNGTFTESNTALPDLKRQVMLKIRHNLRMDSINQVDVPNNRPQNHREPDK